MGYEVVVGRNQQDRERLGLKGCVLLGKHYVKMGQTSSLSNEIWLDVSRSHVVFLCGKRGSGKCLTGDTRITLADGRVVPIERLYEDNERILTLDKELKISPGEREGFYKRKVARVLRMRLRSGREITLTPEHPLLTLRGWVQAQNLTINDRIATPREEDCFGDLPLPREEVLLLAYFLAEGHTKGHNIRFTNFDEALVEEFSEAVNAYDPEARITKHREGHFGVVGTIARYDPSNVERDESGRIIAGSMRIPQKTKCDELCIRHGIKDCLAGDKRIPEAVYQLPKEQLKLFLNRLFSCDGTIYKKKTKKSHTWQVQYASKSKELIQGVQHLLLRFGILSTFRKKSVLHNGKRYPNYELTVQDTERYLTEIGFRGEKEALAEEALPAVRAVTRNPNMDTIPRELWDLYRPKNWAAVGRAMGYAHPKAIRESQRYAPSRQKLLQIAKADEREDMQLLAESDIYWDFITGIEEKQGTFPVYDISVPGTHNFVANDIIVHNSYTMGAMAEGMAALPPEIAKHLSVIILDTMGIYWTMKYPNQRDRELLEQWDIAPECLDVSVYVPEGRLREMQDQGIPADKGFAVGPHELAPAQWASVFGLDAHSAVAGVLEEAAGSLEGPFGLDAFAEAVAAVDADDEAKRGATNLIHSAERWGLFSEDATPLAEIVAPGQVTVLDVSTYATQSGTWNVRALVIGLVAQNLFAQRMLARRAEEHNALEAELAYQPEEGSKQPVVWMLIDEAHEFLPRTGKTPATDALVTLLREGRQPGLSLVLATQQPGKIHTDVMTQSDVIISHRITAKVDTDALSMLTQSYMRGDLDQLLNELPRVKGAAIVLDDNNEKLYSMRVRPRFTWHGGSDPDALRGSEEL